MVIAIRKDEMGTQMLQRIVELEAALTDALYGYGLIYSMARNYAEQAFGGDDLNKRDYTEAEERIQRARLALPKAQEATQ